MLIGPWNRNGLDTLKAPLVIQVNCPDRIVVLSSMKRSLQIYAVCSDNFNCCKVDITPDQRCNLPCSHDTQDFYIPNMFDFINITSLSAWQRAGRKRCPDGCRQSQATGVCEGIKRQNGLMAWNAVQMPDYCFRTTATITVLEVVKIITMP